MLRLVGDVGGTRTRVAIANALGQLHELKIYQSKDHANLTELLRTYLGTIGKKPQLACLAVAGPVRDGLCQATNLPWVISAKQLELDLGIKRVVLLNDFVAQAHGALSLPPQDLAVLHVGHAEAHGPMAILGAGTGLGEAFAVPSNGGWQVFATEGGHCDFAPATERQDGLLRFLRAELNRGHVSYERVLSGPGLASVYQYLRTNGVTKEQPDVADEMVRDDPAAVVVRRAISDPLCAEALDLFVEIYGQEVGNVALRYLPARGVFLSGGISARILAWLQKGGFVRAYLDKGRMSAVLASIPVTVVKHPHCGLVGAAAYSATLT